MEDSQQVQNENRTIGDFKLTNLCVNGGHANKPNADELSGLDCEIDGEFNDENCELNDKNSPASWVSRMLQSISDTLQHINEEERRMRRGGGGGKGTGEGEVAGGGGEGISDGRGAGANPDVVKDQKCRVERKETELWHLWRKVEFRAELVFHVVRSFGITRDWPTTLQRLRYVSISADDYSKFMSPCASDSSQAGNVTFDLDNCVEEASTVDQPSSVNQPSPVNQSSLVDQPSSVNQPSPVDQPRSDSGTNLTNSQFTRINESDVSVFNLSYQTPLEHLADVALETLSTSRPSFPSENSDPSVSPSNKTKRVMTAKMTMGGKQKRQKQQQKPRRGLFLPRKRSSATRKDPIYSISKDDRSDPNQQFHFVNQIVKQFLCKSCNQIFSRSDSYQRHIRSAHLKLDKKFICVICGLSSQRVDNVKKHLEKIHDLVNGKVNVRDFIIESPLNMESAESDADSAPHSSGDATGKDAESSLATAESIPPAYVYISAETKRFVCDICNKDFVTTQAMKRHRKTVHEPDLERIPCTICDAKFTRVDGIKRHMKKLHPNHESGIKG